MDILAEVFKVSEARACRYLAHTCEMLRFVWAYLCAWYRQSCVRSAVARAFRAMLDTPLGSVMLKRLPGLVDACLAEPLPGGVRDLLLMGLVGAVVVGGFLWMILRWRPQASRKPLQ